MTTTEIDRILQAWTDAERHGDRDALDALLADDFVGIPPVGLVVPRHVWVARLGSRRYDRLDLDDISTRSYGDAAVVVARQRAAGEAGGNPLPADTRVSFVIVLAGGRARIAGIQYSPIADVTIGSVTP